MIVSARVLQKNSKKLATKSLFNYGGVPVEEVFSANAFLSHLPEPTVGLPELAPWRMSL